jgi:hypothetical protein
VQDVQAAPIRSGGRSEYTVVSRLQLRAPESRALEWDPAPGVVGTYGVQGSVPFRGLLPDAPKWEFVEPWRARARELQAEIAHLGPLRAEIRPTYDVENRRPLSLTGDEAVVWLATDDALRLRVGAWFVEHMQGWRLGIDKAGSAFHCVLTRAGMAVNLCDAGQGVQQVLPVVVQQLAHKGEAAAEAFFDIVEQPELHLHAAAEAPLADLFVDTARTGFGVVLVETHSENFVLRVRRRIAEGALDAARVALYWVDDTPDGATIRAIRIDGTGDVDFWPEGVFSEAYDEVKAIRRAVRLRGAVA